MLIYCCGCRRNVKAFLVNGCEVLPKEKHLRDKKFWKCSDCRNFVGTRTVGKNDLAPTGAIGSKKIREMQGKLRAKIYLILEAKKATPDAKKILYEWLSKKLFYPYRTSSIISEAEAKRVHELLDLIKSKI